MHLILFIFLLVFNAQPILAQHPYQHYTEATTMRYHQKHPVIFYELQVDTITKSLQVKMHLENIPHTFQLAMFAHPEYDDQFWRYVSAVQVENGTAQRKDSALWLIATRSSKTTITYKIALPVEEGQRAAWRPYLTSENGLIGGQHTFMYVVGSELAPSHVQLHLPQGWKISTALEKTADSTLFFAPTVYALMDAPVLAGNFKKWLFSNDGVPHEVAYTDTKKSVAFDEETFISGIKKVVEESKQLFGRLPYKNYYFLIQDDAWGGLEHANSVTVGAPSKDLSVNVSSYFSDIVHEYFHAWNLVRIRPVEYGDVTYKKPPLSKSLWWSEGLTMYYTYILMRRAGLSKSNETRVEYLKQIMTYYYQSAGNYALSPEKVSLAEYGPPGMLGDYTGSPHLQGELIGTLLDLLIRDATNGKKSIDDVMGKMMEKFSGKKGFLGYDIEQIVSDLCGCQVQKFFNDHIRNNKPLPFNTYLKIIGLKSTVTWKNAVNREGILRVDLKAYAYQLSNSSAILIAITDPKSIWGKAGLHTGDELISINQQTIKKANDFTSVLRKTKMGDTIRLEVKQYNKIVKKIILMSGYKEAIIQIDELDALTEKQKRIRKAWLLGI